MRAACYDAFGGPENVQDGQRPDPAPDADHMLVRTHAAGVGIWDVLILSSPSIPGASGRRSRPSCSPAAAAGGAPRRPGSARR